MPQFGEILQQVRGRMSRAEAGRRLNVSGRTIEAWETRGIAPDPDSVVRMARAYCHPDLRFLFCNLECAIGRTYGYRVLNNIDTNTMTVLAKLGDELEEAQGAVREMLRLAINKRSREDFSEAEMQQFELHYQELLDVVHGVQVTQRVLDQRILDIAEAVRQHNDKCLARGYYTDRPQERENAPLAAGAL